MSGILQNHSDENDLIDCVQRFFSKHHVGNIFAGRSMYIQQRTGFFKEAFSKNNFYRIGNFLCSYCTKPLARRLALST